MAGRRIARSFVVTVSVTGALSASIGCTIGCNTPKDAPIVREQTSTTAANTVAKTTEAPSVTESPNPPAPLEKRKRKATPPPKTFKEATIADWSSLVPLNPTQADGRAVLVEWNGESCFVFGEWGADAGPIPPGMGMPHVAADCLPELDDPAWDGCRGSSISAQKGSKECVCIPSGGNPPPPPTIVACPKKAK